MNLFDLFNISFQNPSLLYIAFAPLILFLLARLGLSHLKRFADGHLLPWLMSGSQGSGSHGQWLRLSLHFLLWVSLALASAGPRQADQDSHDRLLASVDIMVVLDISRSMKAVDLAPDRLSRARVQLLRLVERVRGDRIGLIVYSGKSLLVMPPTRDKSAIRFYLSSLNNIELPIDGGDMLGALKLAQKVLTVSKEKRARAVLLVSDGELSDQSQSGAVQTQVRMMVSSGIRLYSMGVGTYGGSSIPDPVQHWLQHNNVLVKSRLNEERLRLLASIGEGRYALLSDDQSSLDTIYKNGIARHASYRIEAGLQKFVIWNEYYQYPLGVALTLLLILLSPISLQFRNVNVMAVKLSTLMVMAFVLSACSGKESASYHEAKSAYASGEFRSALTQFSNIELSVFSLPDQYKIRMAAASSAYRLERWNVAIAWYRQAFINSTSNIQKARALFNMGNAWAKSHDYLTAISLYKDSLLYDPDNPHTRINLDLIKQVHKNKMNETGYDAGITSRVGKGNRSRRALPGLVINKGSASIDNSPEIDDKSGKGYQYDIGEDQKRKDKIDKAANRLMLSKRPISNGGNANSESDSLDRVEKINFYDIQKKVKAFSRESNIMWRRLFFYENKVFIPKGERVTFPPHKPW